MSIESVATRIAEIRARIAELSSQADAPAGSGVRAAARHVSPANGLAGLMDGQTAPVAPFDPMLAQAAGQLKIRAMGNTLPPEIESLVTKYSAERGLDARLVRSVILAESDGDPRCVSPKGAKGLMQLMPDELVEYGVHNVFDPEENIAAGTRQLAAKLKLYDNDIPLALAAYNAGTGAVRKYGGIPPYRETRQYIDRVQSLMRGMR